MSLDKIKIFSGNANPLLSGEIISSLNVAQGKALVGRFSDGESQVEILENVRGCDVFVLQPTCGPSPAETLMELLVIVDALKRSSAARITAVVPYFGYSRQDRRSRLTRVPITAKLVAKMVEASGVDRILTIDLHADQIQGFFNIPIDNIYAQPVLINDILAQNYENTVVVSPDVGGVVRARAAAKRINDSDLAIIDKRRPAPNMVKVMNVLGDVEGRICILIDDMVDTAGTLCQAASILKEKGAKKVVAYATHAVLSGSAVDNINNSEIDELVITNTVPLTEAAVKCNKIRVVSIAPKLAEVIKRISEEQSISAIFTDDE
ncbi:ribose-phosphate pyrophosphokinase [bacterium endosymbiont of Bathymodiolus sp. 5 South]|jgi:ribose-phosphate pyrophosphokinase|uniref:ribose-phosphate pyrophosphokinase n=1 Tax=bacterium endosymbiont of Bathymodiolus sp. 5 South TaxID=1181670 RepID=UPI0010B8844F|nr:ribose-phosphate pyrophosphokinase [bacterium endosymbiont of Bathymodiolus sp. 5 South]CAC9638722.1 Ribose-phosphate pyrophosphokinase (EC 2.7.6.1) [uncultured Gammaproteobacteria bacterium]CAC9648560.1 Ribose-phosphate pyrophosphokinase (EC 2.7.6.1) [uncultured Gammaproteobacteria bacterium]SHN94053.1 Ribose-phosphate pyrophosphokinase [bacterium endosymbiont of Bathymodiolus sp. 5 South]SSC08757.1 Ribose-phosphate pyrophosphokinase [bacterium endosymbiont of Bathymodiolus sp. 5 South]VVH